MVLNIITGNHFSQMKLFLNTNKFFEQSTPKKLITNRENNYIIQIGKRSIKIVLANKYSKNDIDIIKNYIKEIFKNQSILISSSHEIQWIHDIPEVKIHLHNSIK